MTEVMLANILTAIPATLLALAAVITAIRMNEKVKHVGKDVDEVRRNVNGILSRRTTESRELGHAEGELHESRRADDARIARDEAHRGES